MGRLPGLGRRFRPGWQGTEQDSAADPGQGETKTPAGGPRSGSIDRGDQQPVISTCVLPDRIEQNSCQLERKAVEHNGSTLPVPFIEGVDQNGSSKRQERNVHQKHGVQKQHHPIDTTDLIEHHVRTSRAGSRSAPNGVDPRRTPPFATDT
ncbi:hypothetical protein [Nocardia vinacea]|uniref:hypothetical protein n=1 Tax=Nocardia vinacea TaxID=96468 RepID=UPI0005940E2C|nr:hypothetical protein [Nocardia vinacea]